MSFFSAGLSNELVKLAAEEGEQHSKAKGAVVGGATAAAVHHGAGEVMRRNPKTPFELHDIINRLKGTKGPVGGAERGMAAHEIKGAKRLLQTGGAAGAWHGALAKTLPTKILAGMGIGAGVQALRHRGEKKEAGVFGRAAGAVGKAVSKVPKKAIVGGGLAAAGAYGAGRHEGRKKGEGEAMQVGEQAYGAGARDMQKAIMSELGIS